MNIQMIVFLYQFIHQEVFLKVSNLYACSIYYVEQCLGLNGRMNKKFQSTGSEKPVLLLKWTAGNHHKTK